MQTCRVSHKSSSTESNYRHTRIAAPEVVSTTSVSENGRRAYVGLGQRKASTWWHGERRVFAWRIAELQLVRKLQFGEFHAFRPLCALALYVVLVPESVPTRFPGSVGTYTLQSRSKA